jgi:hypothetical protein
MRYAPRVGLGAFYEALSLIDFGKDLSFYLCRLNLITG